jgi:Carboxypeptidase regulatory-like domain
MRSICRILGWVTVMVAALAVSVSAKPGYGTLSGVVLDPSGLPQMGASVWLISEDAGGRIVSRLLSNEDGTFSTDHLKPGKYAVRVSLAGYLPAIERHVAVMADLTTLLRVQVDTVFSSLDTLRRKSNVPAETDDWKWVLRSSTATRTILQWRDGDPAFADSAMGPDLPQTQHARGLIQLTNGTLRPWSPSNLPDAPATTVSYDQQLGGMGRVLLAGQMSVDHGASGAFASVWLPSGTPDRGPETVFVLHQTRVGPAGLMFQGLRFDHTERFTFGDHVSLRAGAEFLRVGMISSTSSLRPHGQLDVAFSPSWIASMLVAANPPSAQWGQTDALRSAIAALDSLPAVAFRDGSPVLEGGWHEEISVKHKLTSRSSLEVAGFHDAARHQAIFGSGPAANPDFVQNTFSSAFLYDGGRTSSWGARLAYREKFSDNLEFTAIYAWAGALSPSGNFSSGMADLRDSFVTLNHHSVAARISAKVPRVGTQVDASYKWISGTALSRQDAFGEAAYQVDPNLNLSIRQPLPVMNGRWEALADFNNLLAEGYVKVNGQDSRVLFVPILRSFRGGVSFQF